MVGALKSFFAKATCLGALSWSCILCSCTTTTVVVPPDPTPVLGAQIQSSVGGCIDVRDGATADGTPIVLFQCHGSPNQRWFIGQGQIEENFGSCLDVQTGAGAAAIILVSCNGRPSQQWHVTDGQIIGLGDKCLDAEGGNAADLTPLSLADCSGTQSQKWTIL